MGSGKSDLKHCCHLLMSRPAQVRHLGGVWAGRVRGRGW